MADILNEEDVNDDDLIISETPLDPAEDVEDDEDERIKHDEDEEERQAIRERRRQEKQDRKERRDKAITRDKLELDFLRKRNDDLERRITAQEQRSHQNDLSGLDVQYNKAVEEAQMAERVIAKAVEAGNGDDVAQALRYRDQAIAKAQHLANLKQQTSQAPVEQSPSIPDAVLYHAQEFMRENSWYDPQGRDEDSAIVLAVDQTLVRDGFKPETEDYWDELRDRLKRRLPEKFQTKERTPRGGPAVGSGREHAPASTRKEIYISPERKQALIEAGVWDDPVLRMKYVKRYAEYDKNSKG